MLLLLAFHWLPAAVLGVTSTDSATYRSRVAVRGQVRGGGNVGCLEFVVLCASRCSQHVVQIIGKVFQLFFLELRKYVALTWRRTISSLAFDLSMTSFQEGQPLPCLRSVATTNRFYPCKTTHTCARIPPNTHAPPPRDHGRAEMASKHARTTQSVPNKNAGRAKTRGNGNQPPPPATATATAQEWFYSQHMHPRTPNTRALLQAWAVREKVDASKCSSPTATPFSTG